MLLIDWGDGVVDGWLDADPESPLQEEADEGEAEAEQQGKLLKS